MKKDLREKAIALLGEAVVDNFEVKGAFKNKYNACQLMEQPTTTLLLLEQQIENQISNIPKDTKGKLAEYVGKVKVNEANLKMLKRSLKLVLVAGCLVHDRQKAAEQTTETRAKARRQIERLEVAMEISLVDELASLSSEEIAAKIADEKKKLG